MEREKGKGKMINKPIKSKNFIFREKGKSKMINKPIKSKNFILADNVASIIPPEIENLLREGLISLVHMRSYTAH
jgi:hypothetical protein